MERIKKFFRSNILSGAPVEPERTKKLFGITALFDTPDAIIHAADKISEQYKDFDVNTPYPVHGMDRAMKLKSSKIGYITLVFGLSGALFALLFMGWAMAMDYPLIIGGKPFFSLPAYIPITFEVTVLLATLSTVIGMLTFFFNYPQNTHPLIDTSYMKAVSLDKFGICIYASDKHFDEKRAGDLLEELGGKHVEPVYYQLKETYALFEPKFLIFLAIVAALVSGGTYITLNKLMYLPPFDFMLWQNKIYVQSKSDFFGDHFGMRTPVEGTVARGFIPYAYPGQTEPVKTLVNPLLPTKENLELGKRKFLTYCSPCHGNYADGTSRLNQQFPNPPSLHTDRARNFSDGRIYHVITNGQNIMPSYASQITRDERWAIVNYIRVLQRAKNAKESDLEFARTITTKKR
ncbi:MAG TPA: quinol:electron acceptor oxidoreductase subunit ActD [Ignavibacteriaceae bacterium]|nr:quinol:electron acceptor oxidoreductase subunit ActD [Ignavibacteriaceae bacterium]